MPLLKGNSSLLLKSIATPDVTIINLQNIVKIFTLLLGTLALVQIARNACRNAGTIIVIQICGLVHAFYGVIIYQISIETNKIYIKGCTDNCPVYLVAIVSVLCVIVTSALGQLINGRFNSFRYFCLMYFGITLPLLFWLKHEQKDIQHYASVSIESDLIFMKTCQRDLYMDLPNIVMDYIFIYIPFTVLFGYIYRCHKNINESKYIYRIA